MRKFVASLVMAVSAGGLMALGATPANAGHFDGNCESGEACLYQTATFGGAVADFSSSVYDYANWSFYGTTAPLNDEAGSVKNRGRFISLTVYEHANGGGRQLANLSPGSQTSIPKQASSHYF